MCNSLYFTGCVALLTRQVTCQGFSQCYQDINSCFWTDGSLATQFGAQTACRQRNNSFLPRVTDGNVQSRLSAFRTAADSLLGTSGFWIAVKSVSISSFHWIEGSPLAGLFFFATWVHWDILLWTIICSYCGKCLHPSSRINCVRNIYCRNANHGSLTVLPEWHLNR